MAREGMKSNGTKKWRENGWKGAGSIELSSLFPLEENVPTNSGLALEGDDDDDGFPPLPARARVELSAD